MDELSNFPWDDYCGRLPRLLTGEENTHLQDLECHRRHWDVCSKCQTSYPDALQGIDQIERHIISYVHQWLESYYHRYRSEEQGEIARVKEEELRGFSSMPNTMESEEISLEISAPRPDANQELHARLLRLQASAGFRITEELNNISTVGHDGFRVADEYGEFGDFTSKHFTRILLSFPKEIQVFIFQSRLAADLLDSIGGEFSSFAAFTLYRAVEHAAPSFLAQYLEENTEDGFSAKQDVDEIPLQSGLSPKWIMERLASLEQNVEDVGDSLKAGQMEIIRRYDAKAKDPIRMEEIEKGLIASISHDTWERLDSLTRRGLQLAERRHAEITEPDTYYSVVGDYGRVYENELMCLLKAIATSLSGIIEHDPLPDPSGAPPLVIKGRLNTRLTLGNALIYIKKNKDVRTVLTEMGIDPSGILGPGFRILHLRNIAAHPRRTVDGTVELLTQEHVDEIRAILLEEPSALAALLPRRKG